MSRETADRFDPVSHPDHYNSGEIECIDAIRALVELVKPALRDYVLAQSRMSERWADSDKAVRHLLWRDLHVCEAGGREALEALEAIHGGIANGANRSKAQDGAVDT